MISIPSISGPHRFQSEEIRVRISNELIGEKNIQRVVVNYGTESPQTTGEPEPSQLLKNIKSDFFHSTILAFFEPDPQLHCGSIPVSP